MDVVRNKISIAFLLKPAIKDYNFFFIRALPLNCHLIPLPAKPIDLLAKYINAEDEDFDVEVHEPYAYLNVRLS